MHGSNSSSSNNKVLYLKEAGIHRLQTQTGPVSQSSFYKLKLKLLWLSSQDEINICCCSSFSCFLASLYLPPLATNYTQLEKLPSPHHPFRKTWKNNIPTAILPASPPLLRPSPPFRSVYLVTLMNSTHDVLGSLWQKPAQICQRKFAQQRKFPQVLTPVIPPLPPPAPPCSTDLVLQLRILYNFMRNFAGMCLGFSQVFFFVSLNGNDP